MNTAYWIVAGILALFYFCAGTLKAIRSRDQLRPMMTWVDRIPLPALRAQGAVEILGATGLILPPLTGIAPSLAPAAAIGFVLLQTGAIAVHLTGEEGPPDRTQRRTHRHRGGDPLAGHQAVIEASPSTGACEDKVRRPTAAVLPHEHRTRRRTHACDACEWSRAATASATARPPWAAS